MSVTVNVSVKVPKELAEKLAELSEDERKLVLGLLLIPKPQRERLTEEDVERLALDIDRRIKERLGSVILELVGK